MAKLLLQWAARYPLARPEGVSTPMIGKAHFIESEINRKGVNTAVTYCGEELKDDDDTEMSVTPEPAIEDRCEICLKGHPLPA